jgi:hypothetical protein
MTTPKQSWIDQWLAQPLDELTERFRARGADNPEGWAASEEGENIAQMARYLFLHALWRELSGTLELIADDIEALVTSGTCTRAHIEQSLASSLVSLGFQFACLLDDPAGSFSEDGEPRWVQHDEPRWQLMELSPQGELTGRDVGGLHESIGETAPRGEHVAIDQGFY